MIFGICFHRFFHFAHFLVVSATKKKRHTVVFVLIAIPKRKRQTRFCLANQRLSFGSFEDVFDDAPCDALGMGEWREAQHVAQRGADGLQCGPRMVRVKIFFGGMVDGC